MVGSSIVLVRRVLAAVATLALGLGVAPAAGADTSAPSGSGPREFVATTPPFGSGGTRPLGAADVFVPPLSCPSGFVYGAVLAQYDFEDDVPLGSEWESVPHTSIGPLGSFYASIQTPFVPQLMPLPRGAGLTALDAGHPVRPPRGRADQDAVGGLQWCQRLGSG